MLLITIAGRFWCFSNPHIRLVIGTNSTRSNTKNIRSHTVLSFTRGRGTIPTRGTAWVHGGTDDTDITNKFLAE